MKKLLLYAGILLCLIGLFPLLRYMAYYSELSQYGKGYIWGKLLLLGLGLLLILLSRRKLRPGH